MTKKESREINRLLAKIECSRNKMSLLRDVMRAQHEELGDLLESIDGATIEIENGLRSIQYGVDQMSELI